MTHYHLIGIGGTGLSAIGRVLYERGNAVSGSDTQLSPLAQDLIDIGVQVTIGHKKENIVGSDVIIRSSAIPDSNPEIIAGQKSGIPILKRREFLPELTAGLIVIAIAGTHGKTTTTSMIAWCLSELGTDPSYVVGGTVKNLHNNAHAGKGKYFVIEADEYDRMFLGLKPDVLVITNIEHDHPDCFPSMQEYSDAFLELTKNIKPNGVLIAYADHPEISKLLKRIDKQKVITFGKTENCDYRINDAEHKTGLGIDFSLEHHRFTANTDSDYRITLPIPGDHNALNAAAAIAVIETIGLSPQKAVDALGRFQGAGRRFDVLGTVSGITIIDDYAHHPTEIQATLAAARGRYPERNIWTVWQPHTYSRTKELFDDFVISFGESDHVIVTEIFASREKKNSFSSISVVESMNYPDVQFIAKLEDSAEFLKNNLANGDVLLVLSAGDANNISRDVFNYFKDQEGSL